MKKFIKGLVIVGVIGIVGVASAALVGYLSNTVQADIAVESPMEQWISETDSNYQSDPISFTGVRGGESITFYVKTQNHANIAITGTSQNIVTSPGITCDDFVSVVATTTTDDPALPYDLIALGLCSKVNYNKVAFSYGPVPIVWEAEEIDKTEVVVTFQPNTVGIYTIETKVIPVNQ